MCQEDSHEWQPVKRDIGLKISNTVIGLILDVVALSTYLQVK